MLALVQGPAGAAAPLTSSQLGELGLVLVVGALAVVPLVALLLRRTCPGRNVVFARWGFSHVALVVLVIFAALFASSLVEPRPGTSITADLARTAAAFGAGAAIVVWLAARLDPDGVRVLGLRASGHVRAVAAGTAAYILLLPGLLGVFLVWAWCLEQMGQEFEPQAVVRHFAALPPGERLVPVILGTLVVPFLEELLFRAFLQPLLVQNFRERAGIVITSLVFALLHGTSVAVPIFALSLLLGAVMLRTQRLGAAWAIHALHNGLMFTLLWSRPELVGAGT